VAALSLKGIFKKKGLPRHIYGDFYVVFGSLLSLNVVVKVQVFTSRREQTKALLNKTPINTNKEVFYHDIQNYGTGPEQAGEP
jgi:hypothetical protein